MSTPTRDWAAATPSRRRRAGVVLVDDFGRALGFAPESACHRADAPLHLALTVLVLDGEGRLLMTLRSTERETFPSTWGAGVTGHVRPAESAYDAAIRITERELTVGVRDLRLVLPAFRYRAVDSGRHGHHVGGHENELCPVFTAVAVGEPFPADHLLDDARWGVWPQVRDDVLFGRRTVGQWTTRQFAALAAYGDDPRTWPAGDPEDLPRVLAYDAF